MTMAGAASRDVPIQTRQMDYKCSQSQPQTSMTPSTLSDTHVIHCEGDAVAKGVVDMRLRGKMEDGVDLFRFQHVDQEVAALYVPPNKLWRVVR